jgi:hypothetical protein
MKYLKLLALPLAVVILAALFIVMSILNSDIVTEVSIRIREGGKEKLDFTLLGLGKQHALPDYKVKLNAKKRFLAIDLGTKLDTSAKDWITWPVHDVIPLRQLQEVIIIDDDKLANDLVDRIQITGPSSVGTAFECRVTTSKSFDAGMAWFFGTPVGKAVSTGIVLLVVFVVIGGIRLVFRR